VLPSLPFVGDDNNAQRKDSANYKNKCSQGCYDFHNGGFGGEAGDNDSCIKESSMSQDSPTLAGNCSVSHLHVNKDTIEMAIQVEGPVNHNSMQVLCHCFMPCMALKHKPR